MGKYQKNAHGLYDLPGTDQVGPKGLSSPFMVGQRLRAMRNAGKSKTGKRAYKKHSAVPKAIASTRANATRNTNAVEATVAVLNLAEIRRLTSSQAGEVFKAVQTVMSTDEPGPTFND